MKLLKENKSTEKSFEPFDLTLRIETKEEARLFWHVFNRGDLKDILTDGDVLEEYISVNIDYFSEECSDAIKYKIENYVNIYREI